MVEPVLDRLRSVRDAFREFDQFPVQLGTGRIGVFRRNSPLDMGRHGGICPTRFIEVHDCKSHDCDFSGCLVAVVSPVEGVLFSRRRAAPRGFQRGAAPWLIGAFLATGVPSR